MKRHIKIIMSLVLVLSVMLSLAGCGAKNKEIAFTPDLSAVYVCDDGNLLCATVEDFSESYYDIDELKTFVEEQVAEYNESKIGIAEAYEQDESETGSEAVELPVVIKDCYALGSNAVLILSCKNYNDYYEINNLYEYNNVLTSVETTTVKDMKTNGDSIDVGLYRIDGSYIATDKVMKKNKYHVVKVTGTGTVYVQGIIKYTTDNVEVNDERTAATISDADAYIIYK